MQDGYLFMNVYDFDNTIYDGESTFDFYLYCVKHHPMALKFLFVVTWSLIKYKLCMISEEQLQILADKYVVDFLRCCPDVKDLSEKFWCTHFKKIKSFYLNTRKDDDVIVTASFGFLLRTAFERLGIRYSICSEVDLDKCKVLCLCYRKNKVNLFREKYDISSVEDVYTDSDNDEALMKLAGRNVYLVKGNRIIKMN